MTYLSKLGVSILSCNQQIMADTNIPVIEGNENNLDTQNPLIAKAGAALAAIKTHTQACALALTIACGAAHADEPAIPENIILASAENGISDDTQGEIITSSLNAAQIQNQIITTQTQIAELEAKGMDNFSDDDWNEIGLLQDQLVELLNQKQAIENSTQVEQTATIEAENSTQVEQAGAIVELNDDIIEQADKVDSLIGG